MDFRFHHFLDYLLLTNDVEISDAFNSYFSSVSTVDNPDSTINDDVPHIHSKLANILITFQDVTDVIINLKNDKVWCLDLINHTLLKESIHVLSFPLTNLFNRSFRTGNNISEYVEN